MEGVEGNNNKGEGVGGRCAHPPVQRMKMLRDTITCFHEKCMDVMIISCVNLQMR